VASKFKWGQADLDVSTDVYFTILSEDDLWWYTVTPAFEAYNAGHYAGYDIAATPVGAGLFSFTIPANLPAGDGYTAWVRKRKTTGDGNEAATDDILAAFPFDWDGAALKLSTIGALSAEAIADMFGTALSEAYRGYQQEGSVAQLLYEILQRLVSFDTVGTTVTPTKLDGTPSGKTYTLTVVGDSVTGISEAS